MADQRRRKVAFPIGTTIVGRKGKKKKKKKKVKRVGVEGLRAKGRIKKTPGGKAAARAELKKRLSMFGAKVPAKTTAKKKAKAKLSRRMGQLKTALGRETAKLTQYGPGRKKKRDARAPSL